MNSVFQEIEKLRNGFSINIIESLSNRYTFLCQEPDRSKTAYCFSVPIRNIKTNDIVDLRFYHNKYGTTFVGSEATITIADKISLKNQYGMCDIFFHGKIFKKTENTIYINNKDSYMEIRPTLNGLLVMMDYAEAQSIR